MMQKTIKHFVRSLTAVISLIILQNAFADAFRPPAVPLVACDPYFSVWSPADKLADTDTTHWTGKPHRMTALVRIDGKPFRLMGKEPSSIPAMNQTDLEVLPTRTIYHFEGAGMRVELVFMTPALPDDIAVLSRPVTYVTWKFTSMDGMRHECESYLDINSEITVNQNSQPVQWSTEKVDALNVLRMGSKSQEILGKSGDDLRIDWGYLYLAVPKNQNATVRFANGEEARRMFVAEGKLPSSLADSSEGMPAANAPVSAMTFHFGKVDAKPVTHWLMLAYDDLYSIQYMGKNLRPYWRRNGWEASDLLKASAHDYKSLCERCEKFDNELMADLTKAGGENYAKLGALAYRQCFAAGKFAADAQGKPLQFCKENHSNGCISTSDVFYPMSPQFLLFGPSLAKTFIVPFMNYAASERWKFPFAPHDLGTYPKANGQVYGDGERGVNNQMPVEESGNLLILFAAVAEMEGTPEFANLYWHSLEQWAGYLKEKGFDPDKQLCTDDFAGHLAHNVNLSVKAICGLGAFATLCEMRGENAKAEEYHLIAKKCAERWEKDAADGDHFRLAFDGPNTWSQKYNLVWDKVLGLNLFSPDIATKEMAFYLKHQNRYGLPLDNRETYTKLDWITWTATLTQNRADFETLVNPVIQFLNETPDRSPMTDWYQTKSGKKVGFTARPVVGGVFMQMLYDKAVWQKYARREKASFTNWAPIPKLPVMKTVLPAADVSPAEWQYTTEKPAEGWQNETFDTASWHIGMSGFGTEGTPGAKIGTLWNTDDIWLRREVSLDADTLKNIGLWLHHDEDVDVYINGTLVFTASGFTSRYEYYPLPPNARNAFKAGKNLIALHCHQTTGGQYVDLGLREMLE